MNFPHLSGPRIKLIDLSESCLEDMFEYSKNPLLYRYLEFEPQKTMDETKTYLHKLMQRSAVPSGHYWFIRLIKTGKVIGSFGVHDIDWRKKNAEISYGLSPDHWGQGYFQETIQVALKYLFKERGFHRICATTRADNFPSIRSLEKAGLRNEGTLRDYYLSHNGNRHDAVVLAILKSEYEIVK